MNDFDLTRLPAGAIVRVKMLCSGPPTAINGATASIVNTVRTWEDAALYRVDFVGGTGWYLNTHDIERVVSLPDQPAPEISDEAVHAALLSLPAGSPPQYMPYGDSSRPVSADDMRRALEAAMRTMTSPVTDKAVEAALLTLPMSDILCGDTSRPVSAAEMRLALEAALKALAVGP